MHENDVENLIDGEVNSRIQELAIKALMEKAKEITLEKLAVLQSSEKYGPVMKQVTLQEFIDRSLAATGPQAEVVNGKKGRKSKSTNGGGSAKPGRKVNFRDAEEKAEYAQSIEAMIRERAGEPVSTTELTDKFGGSSNQAREILHALVQEGKVVSTGQARATRYYWKEGASSEVLAEFEESQPAAASA